MKGRSVSRATDEAVREDDGILSMMDAEWDQDESTHERTSRALVDMTFGKTVEELIAFTGLSRGRCEDIRAMVAGMLGYNV